MSDPVICPDPQCGALMMRRSGRYGDFYGCTKWPRCKATRDVDGRPRTEREAMTPSERMRENDRRRWRQ
jgi:ssDNA-binding Zn-finger/Zn-ribbon topoisomerase 1